MAAGGTIQRSGNAVLTSFTIAHGLTPTPEIFWVEPGSNDAFGHFERDIDATNITITYAVPPPSGSNNLIYNWSAGYIGGSAGGGSGGGFAAGGTIAKSGNGDQYHNLNSTWVNTNPGRVLCTSA